MDAKLYLQMANVEDAHWWFVARRSIINKMISDLNLPEGAEILDAGCGTGGNLSMLAHHGQVYAMELNDAARGLASNRGYADMQPGCLPDNIPFGNNSFDLIVLLDVLEHLEDDKISLLHLRARLKQGGWLLVTVPAYPFLWSTHDEIHHHYRRYKRKELCSLLNSSGYRVRYVSYFNSLLFPIMTVTRTLQRLFDNRNNDVLDMPPSWVNSLLIHLFSSERYVVGRFSFPFGGSLLLLAQGSRL